MTHFGFLYAAALSLALIFILCRAFDWIYDRAIRRLSTGTLASIALVLAATYIIAQFGTWLSAPQ